MKKAAWEDLDVFLQSESEGGFAKEAVITPQSGEAFTVSGIFDEPFLNAQLGEYDFDTTRPRFLCDEAKVAGVKKYDQLTIDGVTYDIMTGAQPTGDGMAVLELAVGDAEI